MKKAILFLSIICASGLTMVSIYNTVIDAASWNSDIPMSIQTARDYFRHVDPRRFFTVAGPVNLILIVLTLILFWKDSVKIRVYFATSLVFVCSHRHSDPGLLRSSRSHPIYVINSGSYRRDQNGCGAMDSHELAALVARFDRSSLFIQRPRRLLQDQKHNAKSSGTKSLAL